MLLNIILAAGVVSTFTVAAIDESTSNRVGLVKPTDQPVQISDSDIDALISNVFPGNNVTAGTVEGGASTTGDYSVGSGNVGVSDGTRKCVDLSSGCVEIDVPTTETTNNNGGFTPKTPEAESSPMNQVPQVNCECVPYYQCNTNRDIIENGEGLIDVRMKEGPCEDYMDVCCNVAETLRPTEIITPSPPPSTVPTPSVCGQRNFNGVSGLRITGSDNEAQFGEFPWVVAITRKEDGLRVFQCGGSLITPQVVLTAAHCVKGKTDLSVRVGEWDTQRKTEPLPSKNHKVSQVVSHESYYPGALYNDIALLILESQVELAPNVGTICLPEQGEGMDGRKCVASGWGKDVYEKQGSFSAILKKVELPTVSRAPCQEALRKTRLGRRFQLHTSFLCAGGVSGQDTCKGDGGGPLACPISNNSEVYVQAGIVAWGVSCGTENPGVYVNVAQFRNWIDNQLRLVSTGKGNI